MKQLANLPLGIVMLVAPMACTGAIGEGGASHEPGSGGGGKTSTSAGRNGADGNGGSPASAGDTEGGGPPIVMVDPAACKSDAPPRAGASTWRRLTASQYRATVKDLLGIDADTSGFLQDTQTGPFATNAPLPPQTTDLDKYEDAAAAIAVEAVGNLAKLLGGCDTKATGEDACASKFIDDFGLRAFRRPLTPTEKTALTTVYSAGKEESFTNGLQLVVEAALQAPSFLYLAEANGSSTSTLKRLTGYEVASRLSYLLWGTMPDATLFASAKSGKLDDVDGIREEANRLIGDERFVDTVGSFHLQLLGVNALGRDGVVTKDSTSYPTFTADMRTAMLAEPTKFVSYVFGGSGDGSVKSLLAGPYAFPSGPLMQVYGVGSGQLASDGRWDVKDGSRAGLLTLASMLAAHPLVPTRYRAVNRGHVVREQVLCQAVPPPQQAVKFELPPGAEKMTQQELLRAHQENPTCRGCHSLMDSIGFALEGYDLIGKLRASDEAGNKIDTSGELTATDVTGTFTGPKEMAEKLASSGQVRECLSGQWFRYALARNPSNDDGCSLLSVQTTLKTADGDVRKAVLSLVTSDSFRYRRGD
jgi:hypothetical protein